MPLPELPDERGVTGEAWLTQAAKGGTTSSWEGLMRKSVLSGLWCRGCGGRGAAMAPHAAATGPRQAEPSAASGNQQATM